MGTQGSDGNMYHGHRHTVSMSVVGGQGTAPTEWHDLDIRSEHESVDEALRAYLARHFGADVTIHEERGGVLRVDDPAFPPGALTRYYRTR